MQCCESHDKSKKKPNIVTPLNEQTGGERGLRCIFNSNNNTLPWAVAKAEQTTLAIILHSSNLQDPKGRGNPHLSARIGQRFETGNVAGKKGSRRPKASSCRDDHLLKCIVLRQEKKHKRVFQEYNNLSRSGVAV